MKKWLPMLAIFLCASSLVNAQWKPFATFEQGRVSISKPSIEMPNRDFDFKMKMEFHPGAVPFSNGFILSSYYIIRANCTSMKMRILNDFHVGNNGKKIDELDNAMASNPKTAQEHAPTSVLSQTLNFICEQKEKSVI